MNTADEQTQLAVLMAQANHQRTEIGARERQLAKLDQEVTALLNDAELAPATVVKRRKSIVEKCEGLRAEIEILQTRTAPIRQQLQAEFDLRLDDWDSAITQARETDEENYRDLISSTELGAALQVVAALLWLKRSSADPQQTVSDEIAKQLAQISKGDQREAAIANSVYTEPPYIPDDVNEAWENHVPRSDRAYNLQRAAQRLTS